MPHVKTSSGIDWHYDVEGDGECFLFLHGWGVDKRIWRQQSKFFSQFYKILRVDLPGHGQSGWKKINLEDMARDLKEILEKITGAEGDSSKVSIMGSSLGGLLALKFYEVFPGCVKRIIFVGSMPKFSKSHDYPHGLDIEKMRILGEQLDTDYPSIVNVFFRSLFTKEERQTRRYKWIQKFRRDVDMPMKQALVEYLDIMEKEDLREVLKRVHIPLQFINGRGDEICNAQTVKFLQELSPASRFDFFEKCGHFPFLSKPHEFNKLVEEFLSEATL